MSTIDLSDEWKLSAPEREQLRKEKSRFLKRVQDNREAQLVHSTGDKNQLETSLITQATTQQLASFDTKLDNYESLTVEELMRLRVLLDELTAKRDAMLANAHTLPDGVRVFETQDGKRVFNEFGEEVSSDVVSVDDIDDSLDRWEKYDANNRLISKTKNEFTKAENFLELTGRAKEIRNSGESNSDIIKQIDKEIEVAKPDFIRAKEVNLKPELLLANPTKQFAVATQASTTNSVTLEMNVPGLGS